MIRIICGPKGYGKTKIVIDEANEDVKKADGHVVFITDTKRYMFDLVHKIRFIDTNDYSVAGEVALRGFIKGIVACNSDTQYIFIDGIARMIGKPLSETAAFFYMIEKLAEDYNLTITFTVSCERAELPDFIAKYL